MRKNPDNTMRWKGLTHEKLQVCGETNPHSHYGWAKDEFWMRMGQRAA